MILVLQVILVIIIHELSHYSIIALTKTPVKIILFPPCLEYVQKNPLTNILISIAPIPVHLVMAILFNGTIFGFLNLIFLVNILPITGDGIVLYKNIYLFSKKRN